MSRSGYRNRVLLVDDDRKKMAEALQMLLSSQGYLCETVDDGKEALQKIKRQVFDLVVCAYRCEDKDGVTLIQAMQAEKPQLAGLILSSFSDIRKVADDTQNVNGIAYLTRPCQDDKLLKMVETVLKNCKKGKLQASSEEEDRGYILDHKVYSHSAITDLEKVYPGITQGIWDEATDKRKWQPKR